MLWNGMIMSNVAWTYSVRRRKKVVMNTFSVEGKDNELGNKKVLPWQGKRDISGWVSVSHA